MYFLIPQKTPLACTDWVDNMGEEGWGEWDVIVKTKEKETFFFW